MFSWIRLGESSGVDQLHGIWLVKASISFRVSGYFVVHLDGCSVVSALVRESVNLFTDSNGRVLSLGLDDHPRCFTFEKKRVGLSQNTSSASFHQLFAMKALTRPKPFLGLLGGRTFSSWIFGISDQITS